MSRDFSGTAVASRNAHNSGRDRRDRSPIAHDRNRRPTSHYDVKINMNSFDTEEISSLSIKKRFHKLYIPSDFFKGTLNYQQSFPLTEPMPMGNETNFHIFDKAVDRLDSTTGVNLCDNDEDMCVLEPSDVNYRYSAKVILMASPGLADLYTNSIRMADEEMGSITEKKQVFDQIKFLMGFKNANELMAIGGPWSPSLDGENPAENPRVLINTAIRTCRGLTGIDLRKCTRWYRFIEYNYFRTADRLAGKNTTTTENNLEDSTVPTTNVEPSIEAVVLYIPDIHQCMPKGSDEWNKIADLYANYIDEKLNPKKNEKSSDIEDEKNPTLVEPTHYSKLNPASLKVMELRQELDARGLDSKGIKSVITSRLEQALLEEKTNDPNPQSESLDVSAIEQSEEVKQTSPSALPAEEKERIEKLYQLEKYTEEVDGTEKSSKHMCSILVHPSNQSRGGKFDCKLSSLNQILNYSNVGSMKEHTFEVHLFAELFKDMLLRDAAFQIYRALSKLPAKAVKSDIVDVNKFRRTVDVDTLLAISLYERNGVDYIRDYDLEDIILSLNLDISRSYIRSLYKKGDVRKDLFYYRCLTDFDVDSCSKGDILTLKRKRDTSLSKDEQVRGVSSGTTSEMKSLLIGRTAASTTKVINQIKEKNEENEMLKFQSKEIRLELLRTKTLLIHTKENETRLSDEKVKLTMELEEESVACNDVKEINVSYRKFIDDSLIHFTRAKAPIAEQFKTEKEEREAIAKAKKEEDEERERVKKAEAETLRLEKEREEELAKKGEEEEASKMEVVDTA